MDGVGESACVRFFITNSMQFSPLTVHLSVQRATTKSVSTSKDQSFFLTVVHRRLRLVSHFTFNTTKVISSFCGLPFAQRSPALTKCSMISRGRREAASASACLALE